MNTKTLQLENYVPYRLSILSNRVSGTIANTYKNKFAISVTEWRIMAVLGEYPGISADDVSAKTQIEKSILSRSVNKLLSRKLIERDIAENDRRRSILQLSDLGQSVYRDIVPISLSYQEKLMGCFNEEEKTKFDEFLTRLYRHAEELDNNNQP